jgi:hypothetical protein
VIKSTQLKFKYNQSYQLLSCWLGRQDSNLGMAESKSTYLSFEIKARSENREIPPVIDQWVS